MNTGLQHCEELLNRGGEMFLLAFQHRSNGEEEGFGPDILISTSGLQTHEWDAACNYGSW